MSTLVSDIINQAFLDLGVTAVGEAITLAEQTDAFLRLNQIIGSLGTEGATVFTETLQSFGLNAGATAYTLGPGGSWGTSLRAQRVVAWKATSGGFTAGGAPLDFAAFDTAAMAAEVTFAQTAAQVAADQAALAAKVQGAMAPFFQIPGFAFPAISLALSNVPMILGADAAYPEVNVRVFPPPASNGVAEITYWTTINKFNTVNDAVALPDGWERMLHWLLAMDLFPQYARAGQTADLIAGEAQNAKSSIIAQNTGTKGA